MYFRFAIRDLRYAKLKVAGRKSQVKLTATPC